MGAVGTSPADLKHPNGTRRANIRRHGSPSPAPSAEEICGSSRRARVRQQSQSTATRKRSDSWCPDREDEIKSRTFLVDSRDRHDQPRCSPRACKTYRSHPRSMVKPIPMSNAAPGKPLREGDLQNDVGKTRRVTRGNCDCRMRCCRPLRR